MALICTNVSAKVELIPLDSSRIPSNDLIHPELGKLTSELAWQLQMGENPIDLSLLNPEESAVWKNQTDSHLDNGIDEIQVSADTELVFLGVIGSQSGTLRFTVLDGSTGNILTVALDKNLHTLLLRKNMLRKLGYVIPAMKFQNKLKVAFNSAEEKKHFLERTIPENTFGSPNRWLVAEEELTIDLQDALVMLPAYGDHYNLAFGVPPKTQTSRTLRSLIVPYSLLDLKESVNVLSWKGARVEENAVELSHFTLADMNASVDDAKWSLNRIHKLTRDDFVDIVEKSYFPKEVKLLLVEKLISRRNNLLDVFDVESEKMNFNSKVSLGENLVDGRLQTENFEGYASRFAYGDPDSPFRELKYSFLSKIQSDLIDNLIGEVNSKLSLFDLNDARLDYYKEEFQNGLDHFVNTGEFLEQQVGTWVAPIVGGSIILSRDVIVGNYQGSDNLVQTADTFGYGINLGAHVGIEGLPVGYTAFARGTVHYVKTYSHLKPVQSLKASLKEPYRNMIVTLVKKDIQSALTELSTIDQIQDVEERNEKAKKIVDNLNKHLGVGESLVITDRLTPSFLVKGGYSWANTKLSMTVDAKSLMVKRVHIFRKDADTIQVYIDNGKLGSMGVSLALDAYIPVTKIQFKRSKGKYKVELFDVNINSDLSRNPELFQGATALSALLKDGTKELLKTYKSPYKLENNFHDTSSKFSFLNWRMKKLKKRGNISVLTPKNHEATFFKYTHQKMMGINNWAFARDIANYYLNQLTEYLTLKNETWKNPAQTFYGVSKTKGVRFESRFAKDKSGKDKYPGAFLSMDNKREGWKIKEKKLKKVIKEVNGEYGRVIFSDSDIDDATGLKLYSIIVNLNIYKQGVWNILNYSDDQIKGLGRVYRRRNYNRRHCSLSRLSGAPIAKKIHCGQFQPFMDQREKCAKKLRKDKDSAIACIVDLAIMYNRHLKFSDFVSIIGKEHIYLYGTISGFRQDSDILATPIRGNTMGVISSKYWNGPVEELREKIGMQANEFNGSWLRENM